jgi:hypothetical protein
LPRPVAPADGSCDRLKRLGLTDGDSIGQLATFDYALSESGRRSAMR